MGEVKIVVVTELGRNVLQVKDMEKDFIQKSTDAFFGALGTRVENPIDLKIYESMAETILEDSALARLEIPAHITQTPTIPTSQKQETASKPKQLPVINGDRTLSVSIGEAFNKQENKTEQPEHWETGIKVYDGENRYQCYYWCPNDECRAKGKRYIKEGAGIVHCHSCNTKILVDPATNLGFPNRDINGNFYVAVKEKEE